MQDACLGPYSVGSKLLEVGPRSDPPKHTGLSRPHPRLHRHHRHPLPARKAPRPRRKAERSSVRPLPSPQVRFPPSVCGKRTILRQGQYTENRSSRAMRPRHSFLLRWRRFINAPGQVLLGPSPGRPDIGLPVFLRLFQNGFRWCHRFPCCATVLPIRPKCS